MPRSSLITTPPKPSVLLQDTSVTTRGENDATRPLVDRRHQHVRGHDRRDAGRDRAAERHELDRVEPPPIVLDDRAARRASRRSCRRGPGKCLPHAATPCCLQRPDDRGAEPRHDLRDRRQRAIANDGIRGIGVDVEHGRVVEVDADRAQLGGERRARNASASASSPLRPSVIAGGHSVNGAFSRATRPPS